MADPFGRPACLQFKCLGSETNYGRCFIHHPSPQYVYIMDQTPKPIDLTILAFLKYIYMLTFKMIIKSNGVWSLIFMLYIIKKSYQSFIKQILNK